MWLLGQTEFKRRGEGKVGGDLGHLYVFCCMRRWPLLVASDFGEVLRYE